MQRENKITSIYTLNILKMSIQWKSTKDESSKKALLQWWCINPLHIQPTKELNFSPLIGEECQNPDPFPFFFFFFFGRGAKYHRCLRYLSCKTKQKCLWNIKKTKFTLTIYRNLFFISIFTKDTVRLAIPRSAVVSTNGGCYLAFGKVKKAKKNCLI